MSSLRMTRASANPTSRESVLSASAGRKSRWVVNTSSLHGWRLARRYAVLLLVLVIMVGPVLVPLLGAFKSPAEPVYGEGATLFPQHWSLAAFRTLFETTDIERYILNSLAVCALNICSALLFSSVGGYMLSRKGWVGRRAIFLIIMSALIFPFESIMLSLYAQIRSLGLYDTLWAIWLPGMMGPFHLMLMRAAFLGIPDEIEDAAMIDGASEVQRFVRIFLPQVKGSLVVVGLTAFIFAWQDYLWPLLITQSSDHYTMMVGISQLQSSFGTDYRIVLAGAITAVVPIFIVFFCSQKYFFRGIEDGGLKF